MTYTVAQGEPLRHCVSVSSLEWRCIPVAKTATNMGRPKGEWRGFVRLYKLSEPLDGAGANEGAAPSEYVIVSAAPNVLPHQDFPETLIFQADAEGNKGKSALRGYSGVFDHKEALRRAGYAVTREVEV